MVSNRLLLICLRNRHPPHQHNCLYSSTGVSVAVLVAIDSMFLIHSLISTAYKSYPLEYYPCTALCYLFRSQHDRWTEDAALMKFVANDVHQDMLDRM